MAKRSGGCGWNITRDARTGNWLVRFRHDGRRYCKSTGCTDRGEAQKAAQRIYDATLAGDGQAYTVVPGKAPDLADLLAAWVVDYGADHSPRTTKAMEDYAAMFIVWFKTLPNITRASIGAWQRDRLRKVKAITVRKESSGLRMFLSWCVHDRRVLTEESCPIVPSIPKRATGTPGTWKDGGKRAQRRIDLSPEQVEAIIAALPTVTRYGLAAADMVILFWETSLRIATIERLSTPEHYAKGSGTLRITADIDKARYARDLPLSERARAALDRHCGTPGLMFGGARLHDALSRAALAIGLPPEDARKVSPHDLRHAAITDLASRTTNIAGVAYLAGHKHISTTAKYVHAARGAAQEALDARAGRPPRSPVPAPSSEAPETPTGIRIGIRDADRDAGGAQIIDIKRARKGRKAS